MDKCFELFFSGNFEKSCLTLLLSKALGYTILLLSFTLKVPQIKNMLKSKSDKGLSYASIYCEIFIFLLTAMYGFHKGNPISTYGENIIILFQCLTILILCWRYSEQKGNLLLRISFFALLAAFVIAGVMDKFNQNVWLLIGSSTIPLISIARFTQIWTSFKTKDTGPLSSFTFLLSISGGLARVFTIIKEAFDPILVFTCFYAIGLNLVVLTQINLYGNQSAKVKSA